MKITIGKIYVTRMTPHVAIIAVNQFAIDEFRFIGSVLNSEGMHTEFYMYNETGSCEDQNFSYDLVQEYQRPMQKPECVTPIYGQEYYVPVLRQLTAVKLIWRSDIEDITAFDNGLVFLDEEDAQAATEKLIELFKEYICHNY